MIEAEAGLMYITGEEHGPPVKVGVAVTGKNSFTALILPAHTCREGMTT
jgi:crotonobetainyl-CoA:carnitine CoA-transferase CaiB-like acyl-CoA transferase